MKRSRFSKEQIIAHVISAVFATPGESQETEIAQLNFRSGSKIGCRHLEMPSGFIKGCSTIKPHGWTKLYSRTA